jgi:TRAP-type uncharacterized transport system fused permease subunit
MGGICFLVPFLFVAFPSVLEFPNVSWSALAMLVSFGVATWLLSVVVYGALPTRRISKFERMVLAIIGPVVFTLTLFMDGALYKFASPALFLIWIFINTKMPKLYDSLCLKPDEV